MRHLIFFLGAFLLVSQAWAGDAAPSKPYVFNMATCVQNVSCSSYAGLSVFDPAIKALIVQSNACVAQRFAETDPEGYFVESMGLDSNGCLTSRELPRAKTGATMTPHCCLVPKGNDTCWLQCELWGVH